MTTDGHLSPELAELLKRAHGALAESYDDPRVTAADMDELLPALSAATGRRFAAVWCHLKDDVPCGGWYLGVEGADGWHTPSGALLDHLAARTPTSALAQVVDADGVSALVGDRLLDLTSLAIAEGIRVNASNIALAVYRPASLPFLG